MCHCRVMHILETLQLVVLHSPVCTGAHMHLLAVDNLCRHLVCILDLLVVCEKHFAVIKAHAIQPFVGS